MNKFIICLSVFILSNIPLFSQVNSLEKLNKCLIKIQVNNTSELLLDSTGIIEEDYSLGTGFYISSDGLFLTAAHVIKGRNKNEEAEQNCQNGLGKRPKGNPMRKR